MAWLQTTGLLVGLAPNYLGETQADRHRKGDSTKARCRTCKKETLLSPVERDVSPWRSPRAMWQASLIVRQVCTKGVENFPLWKAVWSHHHSEGRRRVQPHPSLQAAPRNPASTRPRTRPMDCFISQVINWATSPLSLFCFFLGTSLKLTSELMKPITIGRHGLPLIIFPGKVTRSGTLWNQLIALSAHSTVPAPAGLCQARGEPHVPSPNNWSLQLGKKSSCERGTHCQTLLATNIAHRYRLWLLAYPPPFRCGEPAQQSRQKIRRTCQVIWVSE